MHGNGHAGFGGRPAETDRWQHRHRAAGRPHSLRLVPRREQAGVAAGLKPVYTAPNAEAAWDALAAFADTEAGRRYPQAAAVWERAWERFVPFLAFTPAVRRLLYTTNSIESLNYQLRKVTKARGHFPSDEAAVKLLWLAIINIEDKRARERARRQGTPAAKGGAPQRLIEGQRTPGWRQVLTELDLAYPGRIG